MRAGDAELHTTRSLAGNIESLGSSDSFAGLYMSVCETKDPARGRCGPEVSVTLRMRIASHTFSPPADFGMDFLHAAKLVGCCPFLILFTFASMPDSFNLCGGQAKIIGPSACNCWGGTSQHEVSGNPCNGGRLLDNGIGASLGRRDRYKPPCGPKPGVLSTVFLLQPRTIAIQPGRLSEKSQIPALSAAGILR